MTLVIANKKLTLDEEIRKLAKDASHASFWGTITLNTNQVYVSSLAAERSRKTLKAGLSQFSKNKFGS